MDTLTPQQLDAWRLFITAHATLIERIDRDLAAAQQIPLHWYDVLIELYEAPDHRLRLSELAQRVVLSRSGLTRLVNRLEAAGFLRREPAPEDGRGYYAVITSEGIAALRRAWPVYSSGIARYFAAPVDDGQTAALLAAFRQILEALADTGT